MSPKTICLWIALLSPSLPMRASDSPIDRATLRGLPGFNIVVDTPDAELQDLGLTAAAIQTEVEQRVLKAGLRIDKNAYEFLGIRVLAAHAKKTDFALCIMLNVYQTVALKRDPKLVSATPTWSVESVLLVPPRQFTEAWTDTVDQLVDRFATAWAAVNPKQPEVKEPAPPPAPK